MTGRYPHDTECSIWAQFRPLGPCSCGATAQQSAFDAGKREGLEEAAALFAKHRHLAVREAAERIRALKDTK
jgi:hypothetical protein